MFIQGRENNSDHQRYTSNPQPRLPRCPGRDGAFFDYAVACLLLLTSSCRPLLLDGIFYGAALLKAIRKETNVTQLYRKAQVIEFYTPLSFCFA
jgi:hypothetical protein